MDPMYLVYEGKRWAFTGPPPRIGDCIAGFIVYRVIGDDWLLKRPESPSEIAAFEAWYEGRLNR